MRQASGEGLRRGSELVGLRRPYGFSREKLSAFERTAPTEALVIVHPVTPSADYGTLIALAAVLTRTDT